MRKNLILQNREEKFNARSILGRKLTRLRMALSAKAADPSSKFTSEEFHTFVDNLRVCASDIGVFNNEMINVRAAVEDGSAKNTPDLSDPTLQLLWAATLLRISRTEQSVNSGMAGNFKRNKNVAALPIWGQIIDTPFSKETMYRHATYINEELRRTDTRFAWGIPGSGFKYDQDENVINIDFLASLISGLEHAHSVMFREIGKSQLSTMFPEKNQKIRDQILFLKEKQEQKGGLSERDYKKLRRLALEWEMRKMLWESAEKNATNRFTQRKGLEKAQDYAYSLNHFLMTSSHFGAAMLDSLRDDQDGGERAQLKQLAIETKKDLEREIQQMRSSGDLEAAPPEIIKMLEERIKQLDQIIDEQNTPERRFLNVLNAVELSFFKNNHLFRNSSDNWKRFGVRPDNIRISKRAGDLSDEFKAANDNMSASGLSAEFNYLVHLCGGSKGLENLQPSARDRWQGKSFFNHQIDSYCERRNEIIERIWDYYIQDIAEELFENLEKELDEELNNEQSQDGEGQEQEGEGQEGQEGQGQEGEGQEGEGQGQEGQQGDPSQGQQGDPSQGQQGDPSQGQQGDPSQGQQSDPSQGAEGPQQPQDYGPNEKPFGEGQEGQHQQDFDPSQTGVDENGSKMDVENNQGNTEKMPDVEVPPEHPEGQEPGQEADGQSADGEGQGEGADGKTLDQIEKELEELRKKMQEEMEGQEGQDGQEGEGQEGQKGDQPGDSEGDESSEGAGEGGEPKTLDEIASMEWKSYAELMAHLRGYAKKTARVLQKIRDIQIEKTVKRSKNLELLPEGKEMDRLDYEAHQNLTVKKITGQELEKEDLHRFQKDERHHQPTTIDIVLLIDGSGSMTSAGYIDGKSKPMDIALLSSIILYEAAKEVGANIYIALWGNEDPTILAKPGDDPRMVEENLLKAKRGLSCGTSLAPSIKKITKVLSEHKSSQYSGYTHMMVISDGDINDSEKAIDAINTLLSTTEYATLEFAILKKETDSTPVPSPYGGGYIHHGNQVTAMEEVAEKIKVANPRQKIGVHRDGNPDSIPAGIVGLIFQKIRTMKSFSAVPWGKKRKLFQKVNRKFDM